MQTIILKMFRVLIVFTVISFSANNHLYSNEDDKYYIRSTTHIEYYDNNQLVSIPVCLRTLKKDLVIKPVNDNDRGAGITDNSTLLYKSNTWQLVLSPGTSGESITYLDNMYLVEGELHDGVLHSASLNLSAPEEKLFIYYFQYATSSMEEVYVYYYDVNMHSLNPIIFQDFNNEKSESVCILAKTLDQVDISPINESKAKKYKIDVSKQSFFSREFWVGTPNFLVFSFWNFIEDSYTFEKIYREVINQETGKLIKKYRR